MKIKLDFVTNSSSTSYCLLGARINLNDTLKEKLYEILVKGTKRESIITLDDYLNSRDSFFEGEIINFCNINNLTYSTSDEDFTIIGKNPESLDENKTIKENKEDILNILKKIGLIEKIQFYVGSKYEG